MGLGTDRLDPYASLYRSMNSTISVVGGTAPPRRKPMPASNCHWPGAAPYSPREASAFLQTPHSSSPAGCRRLLPPFSPSCGPLVQTQSQVSRRQEMESPANPGWFTVTVRLGRQGLGDLL